MFGLNGLIGEHFPHPVFFERAGQTTTERVRSLETGIRSAHSSSPAPNDMFAKYQVAASWHARSSRNRVDLFRGHQPLRVFDARQPLLLRERTRAVRSSTASGDRGRQRAERRAMAAHAVPEGMLTHPMTNAEMIPTAAANVVTA